MTIRIAKAKVKAKAKAKPESSFLFENPTHISLEFVVFKLKAPKNKTK